MERNQNQTLADTWAYMLTWLTPTSLFLLLNLTIATIVISHRFHKPPQRHENPTGIVRTRSLLDRVRSFNYTTFQQEHVTHHQDTSAHENPNGIVRTTPSLLERVMSFQRGDEHVTEDTSAPGKPTAIVRTPSMLARLKSMDFSSLYRDVHHVVHRSNSEKGEEEGRPEKTMKKTRSERGLVEENDEGGGGGRQRMVKKTMSFGDDEGVDAKADDFINRFKQQLKLQRLDSLLRYKCNNNNA